jgi:cysteine-rich repeat protein
VIDIGDGACPAGSINSLLTVLGPDGVTVLATDEDAGEGFCSKAILPSLAVGTYFVRVEASPNAVQKTFVYRLRVDLTVDVCGDGIKGFSEACDDGNTMAGDGCSPTCTVEVSEIEPNDTTANANTFVAPYNAVLTPQSDIDIVAVNIAASGASLTATTTDQGSNACAAKTLDTKVEILAPNGTTVLAMGDDIVGNCGSALATNLAAGTYYVRITGGSLVTDPSPYGLNIIIQ